MNRPLQLLEERHSLLHRSLELVEELSELAAGHVIACVVRCRDELERMGVRDGLATATIAMARTRLQGDLVLAG